MLIFMMVNAVNNERDDNDKDDVDENIGVYGNFIGAMFNQLIYFFSFTL